MILKKANDVWVFECTFLQRNIPKEAGFVWNANIKAWQTEKDLYAYKLIEYANEEAKELLLKFENKLKNDADEKAKEVQGLVIPLPKDAPNLMPYQKEGVYELLNRGNVLLADDMGLGKSAQTIAYCNVANPQKILVVCPNSLKINWYKEFRKFCVHDYTFHICTGKEAPQLGMNVNIINYDILKTHIALLRDAKFDLVIADEAHYVKNSTAQRSKAFYSIKNVNKKIALTGTPIPNRPIEAFSILKWLDSKNFSNRNNYAVRYCNAHMTQFGWDESGARNLEELQDLLRSTVMVRRLKKDVLTDLPPKTRQIIEIGNISEKEKKAQLQLIQQIEEAGLFGDNDNSYEGKANSMKIDTKLLFAELARLRKENALRKIGDCVEHIESLLENIDKVVIFCHHREILERLVSDLKEYNPVFIYGETSIKDRDNAVTQFQNNKDVRVFVGSIGACATGITLTASNTEVFVELDWTPANISQAEDRCHRIGQKDNVLVQHLVLAGSIDVYMAQTLIRKQNIIDKALN